MNDELSRLSTATDSGRGGSPKRDLTVTVVIPFYNVEDYIADCLRSVISQEYTSLEILLVDDGSPDRSRSIAEDFAAKDDRIRIITHDQNRGLGPARNTGVLHATGIYLFFLDSDDLLSSSQSVTKLVAFAESSGCRVVVGGSDRLLPDHSRVPFDGVYDREFEMHCNAVVRGVDAFLAGFRVAGAPYLPLRAWGALIETSLYNQLSLNFPAVEHEDLGHTPFLYYLSGGVFYVREVVVTYRLRAKSISNLPLTAAMARGQVRLWQCVKENIERFRLHKYLGDIAMKVAEHMVWRAQENGIEPDANSDLLEVLEAILLDARHITNMPQFRSAMDTIRKVCSLSSHGLPRYRRLTDAMPNEALLAYYRLYCGEQGAEAQPASLATPGASPVPCTTHLPEQRDEGFLLARAKISEALFICDHYLTRYEAVTGSTSWRLIGRLRRLAHRFPMLSSYIRRVIAPFVASSFLVRSLSVRPSGVRLPQ
jgi:glycosyltransferase involved in cell wall biosynthesis